MHSVWTPEKKPPHPSSVSEFSTRAEQVWRAICQRHQPNSYSTRSSQNDSGLSYYQSVYQQKFGTFLNESSSEESQNHRFSNQIQASSTQSKEPNIAESRNYVFHEPSRDFKCDKVATKRYNEMNLSDSLSSINNKSKRMDMQLFMSKYNDGEMFMNSPDPCPAKVIKYDSRCTNSPLIDFDDNILSQIPKLSALDELCEPCSVSPAALDVAMETRIQSKTEDSSPPLSELLDLSVLCDPQYSKVCDDLLAAKELALTLVYNDNSTQLREIPTVRKRGEHIESKAVNVALAYPERHSSGMKYCIIKLTQCPRALEMSSLIDGIMSSKARKLVFDGQKLIETLMLAFKLHEKKIISDWSLFDAKIAAWLLNPDCSPVTFSQILSKTPHLKQTELDPEKSGVGNVCQDLDKLWPVMSHLHCQLKSQGLWMLYEKIEMPLCPILACMQQRGLTVNTHCMVQAGAWMKKKLIQLEKEAFSAAGHSFLINSHPQLRQVLFEELKLDEKLSKPRKIARTASNQYKSTSEAVLTQLSAVHPLPAIILQYRQIQKVKSTYIDGMLNCVIDSELYTKWDQTQAVTGRLTSTSPNIQAIPKQPLVLHSVRDNFIIGQEDLPVQILAREPFITKPGWSFIAADFQQIELRILAHLSADPSLLSIFNTHTATDIFVELAAQWLGKTQENISQSDREQAKRVVYSVMYGVGKERLAEYMKVSIEHAKAIITSFIVKFPGITSFTQKCISEARNQGFQCTILGRRRWFPQINSTNPGLRSHAERQAVNFCIQGSAADLCKAAMIQLEHNFAASPDNKSRLLVQIHDELLIEVPDEKIDSIMVMLRTVMESSALCVSNLNLQVPLTVSFSIGKSWAHMEPVLISSDPSS